VPEPAPQKASRADDTSIFAILGVTACGALGWALMLDVFGAGAWRSHSGLAVALAPSGFVLLLALVSGNARGRWAALAGLLAAVILIYVPWHPRKVFVLDLDSVHRGMTVDEVEAVMGKYVKGVGAKWVVPGGVAPSPDGYPEGDQRAHASGRMTYRWCTTDSAYDADWGQVEFLDGKVVRVEFLPD
jgi:hypothetical protein